MLTQLSDGLFIVAATALQYTLGSSIDVASVRFETLLNASRDTLRTGAAASLDSMYALIIVDAARAGEAETDELTSMLEMLGALLSARMMLSVTALADILEVQTGHLRAKLAHLHAVVHVPDTDDDPGLCTLHASFGDYLFGRAEIHLRISDSLGHDVLARGCLRRMASDDLCFNVSRSQSSFKPNPATPPYWLALSLLYACLHWAYHIDSASDRSAFDEEVGRTFRSKFLFWLEVLSITGHIGRASGLLRIAGSAVDELEVSQFLQDANTFVASSHGAIGRSAPHIYLSALPFAAEDSLIYRDFAQIFTGFVSVTTVGIDRHGDSLVATLTGHTDDVRSVVYSPDGRLLASGSYDGTVRIWDTRTGEEIMPPLHSGDGPVSSVAFDPKSPHVAWGTGGSSVHVWSIMSGRPVLHPLRGHSDMVLAVTYSPDGALIASASVDATVRLWRAETGLQVFVMNGHMGQINAIAFSPDGRLLASASANRTVGIWASHTGKLVRSQMTGSNNLCLGFSPDGNSLVAGSITTGLTRVWDFEAQQPTPFDIANLHFTTSLAFSPDGSTIALSESSNIRSWDPQGGPALSPKSFTGHADAICSLVFSPDGRFIASGSKDRTVRIWDALSGLKSTFEPLPGHSGAVTSVAVSSDGTFITSGSGDGSVGVWDAATGQARLEPLVGHGSFVAAVVISPDGRLIASASTDHTVRLWDADTGESAGEPLQGHTRDVNTAAFSPDGRWLASGSNDNTVRVWDVTTTVAETLGVLTCPNMIHSVAFSLDSQLLAAADSSGYIHFWSSETGQPAFKPLEPQSQTIFCITFSPVWRQLASGADGVRVWDVASGRQVMVLVGHSGWVRSVQYSPDGWYIASASDDSTVRLWDARNGAPVAILSGHGSTVASVAFTPNRRSIVSGSVDATIHVWDLDTVLGRPSQADHIAIMRLGAATIQDGWLLGPSGELLLWVPEQYRGHILLPPCTMIIGRYHVTLTVNDTGGELHWGDKWTACWNGPTPFRV